MLSDFTEHAIVERNVAWCFFFFFLSFAVRYSVSSSSSSLFQSFRLIAPSNKTQKQNDMNYYLTMHTMRATFCIVQMKHLKFDNWHKNLSFWWTNRTEKERRKERWTNANFIVINAHSRTTSMAIAIAHTHTHRMNGTLKIVHAESTHSVILDGDDSQCQPKCYTKSKVIVNGTRIANRHKIWEIIMWSFGALSNKINIYTFPMACYVSYVSRQLCN